MTFSVGSQRLVHVNSTRAVVPSSGIIDDASFSFLVPDLDRPISGLRYTKVALVQAAIPKSYYSIPVGGNTFTLIEFIGGPLSNPVQVTITPGTYTGDELATQLSAAMTAVTQVPGNFYVVSRSVATNRYVFTATSNTAGVPLPAPPVALNSAQLQFTASNALNPMWERLGFDPAGPLTGDEAFYTMDAGNGYSLTARYIAQIFSAERVYIRSSIVSGYDRILASVSPAGVEPWAVIGYENWSVEASAQDITQGGSNVISFRITDAASNNMQLNGGTVTLTLLLYTEQPESTLQNSALTLVSSGKISAPRR